MTAHEDELDALGELLANAPDDDESTSREEDAGAAEARAQIARGQVVSADDIRRDLRSGPAVPAPFPRGDDAQPHRRPGRG